MDILIEKAATLLEALPYIQQFRDEIFVVKYGGSFMDSDDPETREGVARDIVFLEAVGINPVVVHGGGKAISREMERRGLKPQFIGGLRATDGEAVSVVEETLSRRVNPEIVSTIQRLGGVAKGFSGTEVLGCEKRLGHDDFGTEVDIGFVGTVTQVNEELLRQALSTHATPVISPTALGPDGNVYNCNADIAAAQVAIALKARRLVYMSDVPGLMRDPQDLGTVISHLRVSDTLELRRNGVIGSGMIPKVDSAVEAVTKGVNKVSFVDGRVKHSILLEIFTDAGLGTEVVAG